MFGYDAGVLGGVQETEPFRNAIGVSIGLVLAVDIHSND